jgi:sterol desaturase/sphingolipid hydroxylase (fatty acid hydroxylase superfamily)
MNESVNVLGPASENAAIAFLASHQSLVLLVATFGGMFLLLMAESLWPRRSTTDLPVARWLNNWLLAYLNFAAVLWLVHLAASSPWARSLAVKPGLLDWLPPALGFLALLVVLEFGGYVLHRAFHASPFLWRFHAVHHLDTEVDVTTSHRHHTVEAVAVSLVFLPVFLLLGVSPALATLVALTRLPIILISHSNLAFPERADRVLRWLLVTPDFHRLHHSSDPHYTNSNYGTVLPWFDYLFKTASDIPYQQQKQMLLGLEYLRAPQDGRLDRLLLLPLVWRRKVPARNQGDTLAALRSSVVPEKTAGPKNP